MATVAQVLEAFLGVGTRPLPVSTRSGALEAVQGPNRLVYLKQSGLEFAVRFEDYVICAADHAYRERATQIVTLVGHVTTTTPLHLYWLRSYVTIRLLTTPSQVIAHWHMAAGYDPHDPEPVTLLAPEPEYDPQIVTYFEDSERDRVNEEHPI